ncbi:MAG: agmatinase [Deltaproteobacteria bacterium CG11_big_fil_rev_8_21_14_0_20_47_16]|nr:MAG: agmatinase [Deltaproteobacteria bacterium CG11_big_fil_rev_8_21_14_0_20_47_16]
MTNIYYDIPKEFSLYNNANVVIVPCPYEHTTSYGQGTSNGPAAILEASRQVEYFDEELWTEPYKAGIFSADPIAFAGKTGEEAINQIAATVGKFYADNKLPIILGGEHSLSTGCIMAAHRAYPDLTVVQVDAHGDLRTSYHETPWSHACIMRRVDDLGIPSVGVGIRAICEEEAVLIREKKLKRIFAHELDAQEKWIDRALDGIKGPVFLTFDVDGIDPSLIPATGTPEPGGLTWQQSTHFIKALCERCNVVGMDFVELAPNPEQSASDFAVARLVYKSIGYWARAKGLI